MQNNTTELSTVDSNSSTTSTEANATTQPILHSLQTPWTLWFYHRKEKLLSSQEIPTQNNYQNNLEKVATFDTVEQFSKVYTFLKRPSQIIQQDKIFCTISMFRDQKMPAWESFPQGGIWFLSLTNTPRNYQLLDKLWESLLLLCTGEQFEEPEVEGAVCSIQPEEVMFSIWHRDCSKEDVKRRLGEKMKHFLHLHSKVIVQYKTMQQAMKDKRSYVNAESYIVPDSPLPGMSDNALQNQKANGNKARGNTRRGGKSAKSKAKKPEETKA